VANIYKYYLAYKMLEDARAARAGARPVGKPAQK